MSKTQTYSVPGISCGHCQAAITAEVSEIAGVTGVAVDLDTKLVQVTGDSFTDESVAAAIDEAGYEVAS